MTKYSIFIASFEALTMDVRGMHTFIGMDGYYSKEGKILLEFQIGKYTPALNNGTSE